MEIKLRMVVEYGFELYKVYLDGQPVYTTWSEGRARLEYHRYKSALSADTSKAPDQVGCDSE